MADDKDKKNGGLPSADFEEAVALARNPAGGAPRVTAKGRGEAAQELIRLALEYNIPIKYDPDLVQVLSKLDVGRDIPEEVYLVVAEILAFVYLVNQGFGPEPGRENPSSSRRF